MRDIRELLELVRDEFKRSYYSGLCIVVDDLYDNYDINEKERKLIIDYINRNIHTKYQYRYEDYVVTKVKNEHKYGLYYWEKYEKKGRLMWLNRQINKLNKQ